MIDTIRFKIPRSEELLKSIKEKCVVVEKSKMKITLSTYTIEKIYIGSYDRHLNIIVDSEERIFIEFSAPKYLYGHNINLLYPSDIPKVILSIYLDLKDYFGTFPNFEKWVLQRVDLCYAWSLQGQEEVKQAISILKTLSYSRKKQYSRDESIMYVGSAYSVKFYNKYSEFLAHDNKEISHDQGFEQATELLDKSKRVLRFEASLKKNQVVYEFGERSSYAVLMDKSYLYELLNKYLNKYFNNLSLRTMEAKTIERKLILKYGKTKGIQLFQFYNMYFSESEWFKKSLYNNYHRTQIRKKLLDISNADVGISNQEFPLGFEFTIPSKDVVNEDDYTPV